MGYNVRQSELMVKDRLNAYTLNYVHTLRINCAESLVVARARRHFTHKGQLNFNDVNISIL